MSTATAPQAQPARTAPDVDALKQLRTLAAQQAEASDGKAVEPGIALMLMLAEYGRLLSSITEAINRLIEGVNLQAGQLARIEARLGESARDDTRAMAGGR